MNIVIIGATSAIAEAFAKRYCKKPASQFLLVGRNEQKLQVIADDLSVRGAAKCHVLVADLEEKQSYSECAEKAQTLLGKVDLVLMAHGVLGDQKEAEQDVDAMLQIMNANATSSLALLTLFANMLEQQGSGVIAFISSVAGDRGRPSNYVYGASKAVVTTFLQGLRARLAKSGVHVLTIKPGFVDTPMTAAFDKGLLWVKPEVIAEGIEKAIDKRKDEVYLPWFWQIIMAIITRIPEKIFKKLSL
jgi:short-subunit dehydrogenase